MNYIKQITWVLAVFLAIPSFSQGPFTSGNAGNGPFWRTGGNFQQNSGNIFGNQWDSPIYTICGAGGAANFRTKINANYQGFNQYSINGFGSFSGVDRTGYMLLGYMTGYSNVFLEPGGNSYGAFSLFHLNGRDGTFIQEFGYRPWMKTGITFTDNDDLSYVGMRKLGTGTDRTESTITQCD